MAEGSLNPLMAKVKLPGRVFQLPSKALFYPPGVLADSVQNGEIQVKPMSALVELKIRSADLLISTKIIREVCADCIPEILKPEQLLSKDVDAMFLFLIASTYGNEKTIRAIHTCENADIHDYVVNLEPIINEPKNKVLDHKDMLYTLELDNGQIVKLRPVQFNDAIDMMVLRQAITIKEINAPTTITHKEMEDIMVRDIMSVIEGVKPDRDSNTITDLSKIDEWIRALPKKYIDLIAEASNRASDWGFDLTVSLNCKDCSKPFDHNIELNPINFFSG